MVRKVIIFVLIVLGLYFIYWFAFKRKEAHSESPKMASVTLKKHSAKFNQSIDSLVNAYLNIKNAFVNSDTGLAKQATTAFITHLDNLPLDEMKTDTAMVLETVMANISDLKQNAQSLLNQTSITEMRKDFSSVTEAMYPAFFIAVNYEGPKLYFVNCPMAFDDSVSANWISNSAAIVNPYLGKDHPKYKAGMLGCGEVKDSVMAK